MRVSGTLHGRVVRPPQMGAKLLSVDEVSVRHMVAYQFDTALQRLSESKSHPQAETASPRNESDLCYIEHMALTFHYATPGCCCEAGLRLPLSRR
jgi:hypothetical protein